MSAEKRSQGHQDPVIDGSGLTLLMWEDIEEREAILEFDANVPRERARELAIQLVRESWERKRLK